MTRIPVLLLGVIGLVPVAPGSGWSQTPDSVQALVSQVRQAASVFVSTDSARLRRFIRLRPVSRVPGLNPFVGEHWFKPANLRFPSIDLSRPGYLMYYPISGREQLVGVGYAFNQKAGTTPPSGFKGFPAHWHIHQPCTGLPGVGNLLLAGPEECRELGGSPGDLQIAMLHVWLEPNPDGEFGSENPALPFLAAGLRPPDSVSLSAHGRSTFLRKLGLALGETIGARPRYGTMAEFGADSMKFRSRAAPLRARLLELADSLRRSERDADSAAYARAAGQAVASWEALERVYLELAPGPVSRTLMERWFTAVLAPGHGLGH